MPKRRIKHNDLLPWFTDDHGQLPASYLKHTQKFFDGLQVTSYKPQATSYKLDRLNIMGYYKNQVTLDLNKAVEFGVSKLIKTPKERIT